MLRNGQVFSFAGLSAANEKKFLPLRSLRLCGEQKYKSTDQQ